MSDCEILDRQCVYRGDTLKLNYTIKEDGVPVNITGSEFRLTVRDSPPPTDDTSDVDAKFTSLAVVTDPLNGVFDFNITPEQNTIDPFDYTYDVQWKNADGDIQTLGTGIYEITADITRSE